MEILITIAYFFCVRLVFFEYKWFPFNLAWKFVVFGLYSLAALTEIVMLGQYTPYSKMMFVQQPVLQMAPEYGGIVKALLVEPNVVVDKGTVLFEMDATPWQDKVDELTPEVALAQRHYDDARALVRANVEREVALERRRDELAAVKAELERARYNVENAEIVAPSQGYVINLQLRPGTFIRIKTPVMTFISTEEQWIVALIRQRAIQHVLPGNRAQIALEMYPGKVFEAKVENVIFGIGNAQFVPSGVLPSEDQIRPSDVFAVKLTLVESDPRFPLRFGASGLATVFTQDAPDVFVLLRRLEIQSEAFLLYLYNPFG
jgi:multidrug resistance efflux pump